VSAIVPAQPVGADAYSIPFVSAEVCIYMKKDIHPDNYRKVIFQDASNNDRVLVGSTVSSSKTDKWEDGNEYPLIIVDVTSTSHPFYTGQEKVMDTAGRVERFKARTAAAADRRKKGKK